MNTKRSYIVYFLGFIYFFCITIYGILPAASKKHQQSIEIDGKKFTLSEAMHLVIKNSLTIRKSIYRYLTLDADLNQFLAQYAIHLHLDASYDRQNKPAANDFSRNLYGEISALYTITPSLRTALPFGTKLSMGLITNRYDANDTGLPGTTEPVNPLWRPQLFIDLRQQIIKNVVGLNERKKRKILEIQTQILREAILEQLSVVLVESLFAYWMVIINKDMYKSRVEELNSMKALRKKIIRNAKYGISERFEINNYNGFVLSAQNQVELSKFELDDSIRTLLRLVNLPVNTKLEGLTDLIQDHQYFNVNEEIKKAFHKRIDYKNKIREIKKNTLQKEIAKNELLPDLDAVVRFSGRSQNEGYRSALGDVLTFSYPNIYAGLEFNYAFNQTDLQSNFKNAILNLKKSKIDLNNQKRLIRDEIVKNHESINLKYKIYTNSKKIRISTEKYYFAVRKRVTQGKFTSVILKTALDEVIRRKSEELRFLVNYNIALVTFSLSKNEIFEKYGIKPYAILDEFISKNIR